MKLALALGKRYVNLFPTVRLTRYFQALKVNGPVAILCPLFSQLGCYHHWRPQSDRPITLIARPFTSHRVSQGQHFMQLACVFVYPPSDRQQQSQHRKKKREGRGGYWKVWIQTVEDRIERKFVMSSRLAACVRACVYTDKPLCPTHSCEVQSGRPDNTISHAKVVSSAREPSQYTSYPFSPKTYSSKNHLPKKHTRTSERKS